MNFCRAAFSSGSNWQFAGKGVSADHYWHWAGFLLSGECLEYRGRRAAGVGRDGRWMGGAIFSRCTIAFISLCHGRGGDAGRGLWGAIPAVLKVRFRTNEILVSLMLTYVAALLLDWIVRGPWRDPMSFGFPLTKTYPDAGLIPALILPGIGRLGQLHWGVIFAFLIAVGGWFYLSRMLPGYQIKLMGDAPRAGRFAGFLVSPGTTISVLVISGALAGLAGMVEVSANIGQLQPNVSFGYGFTAIIVAFLARLEPIGGNCCRIGNCAC